MAEAYQASRGTSANWGFRWGSSSVILDSIWANSARVTDASGWNQPPLPSMYFSWVPASWGASRTGAFQLPAASAGAVSRPRHRPSARVRDNILLMGNTSFPARPRSAPHRVQAPLRL